MRECPLTEEETGKIAEIPGGWEYFIKMASEITEMPNNYQNKGVRIAANISKAAVSGIPLVGSAAALTVGAAIVFVAGFENNRRQEAVYNALSPTHDQAQISHIAARVAYESTIKNAEEIEKTWREGCKESAKQKNTSGIIAGFKEGIKQTIKQIGKLLGEGTKVEELAKKHFGKVREAVYAGSLKDVTEKYHDPFSPKKETEVIKRLVEVAKTEKEKPSTTFYVDKNSSKRLENENLVKQ